MSCTKVRAKGKALVLKLEGVDDRDGAEALLGQEIGFSAEDYDADDFPRPEQPAPFIYHGLTVRTRAGETLGEVAKVMVLPAHLVLQLQGPRGELLIPVIPPLALELDLEARLAWIDPIPGLLDGD